MSIGEYVSPDGALRFVVICPDGDWTVGFDGFAWHSHGSILAALSGEDEIAAIDRCVADLVGNISVIALRRTSGRLTDVWITDDPAVDMASYKKYGQADETLEFRFWNGTTVKV